MSLTIVEGLEELGGIWDLFRFPGVRLDTFVSLIVRRQ